MSWLGYDSNQNFKKDFIDYPLSLIHISFQEIIKEEEKYNELLEEMAKAAKADGCTKTNPVIPELDQFKALFQKAYKGE